MTFGSPLRRSLPAPGTPCWVELATGDEDTAQRFYGKLFGWRFDAHRDPSTPTGRYLIATLGGSQVGGLYRRAEGSAPQWTVNISVHNTAGAAEWVARLGGVVTLGPVGIPRRGSVLHAMDPAGAPLVLWQPPPDWDFGTGVPNTFATADLNTHDGATADAFFGRLFRYRCLQIGDHHGIDYAEWQLDHQPVLYRYVMGPEYPADTPPHWMVYFAADPAVGVDATAGHAVMLGGRIVVGAYDSPWGRIAVVADPDGAVFSIVDRNEVPQDWGRAEVDDPYDD
ncbi:VOC family protein [Amycolatopsis rhizosphaerae]|uniref:VOC family protein n=1 Tax=Amycolatopsis rhizosphaerae TaxID=2053003 RepID=A0A558C668_9PSEU|nr:VOC family protein [Amycolatopsis rhizosphaerae]TVT44283.1 VOC family protein [Amycolatopsis rhizosphaerae]